jgi:hypothetical protein
MKNVIFFFVCAIYLLSSCDTEGGVKLTSDDRYRVDTLVSRQTSDISSELDKWCKDSTPIYRQHFVDSLVIVREQEILKQTTTIGQ